MKTIWRVEDESGFGPYRGKQLASQFLRWACTCGGPKHTPTLRAEGVAAWEADYPDSESLRYACPSWETLTMWWCPGYRKALAQGKGVFRLAKYEVPDNHVLLETARQLIYNSDHAKLVATRDILSPTDFDNPL